MLRKIISIENVGRFKKLIVMGQDKNDLPPVVAIYAENGAGKTTLASVLRAAERGDPAPITSRKTLTANALPTANLLTHDGSVIFDGTKWSGKYPKLCVFNRDFVHDNVFVGREIGANQREALYDLAIGAKSVTAKDALSEATKAATEARAKLRSIEERIGAALVQSGATMGELEAVPALSARPDDLDDKRARLSRWSSGDGVRGLPLLVRPQAFDPIAIDRLKSLVSRSVETLSTETADAVRKHLESHLDERGEEWLARGTNYASKGTDCPYCGQSLATSEVASLFPKYFDGAYKGLVQALNEGVERLGRLRTWLKAFVAQSQANGNTLARWTPFVESFAPPPTEGVAEALETMVAETETLLRDKLAMPLHSLGDDSRLEGIATRSNEIGMLVAAYNAWCEEANSKLTQKRNSAPAVIASMSQDIVRIELGLLKGKPEMQSLLTERTAAALKVEVTQKAKDDAEAKLAAAAKVHSAQFIERINGVLERFGAEFRITGLSGTSTSSRVISDYALELLNGGKVKASAKKGGEPTFDTVLSEGDRNALGLAVFVTTVLTRADIKECTVVVDDPFTSLDSSRRFHTCQMLNETRSAAAQLIILSHDEMFLRDAIEACGGGALQRKLACTGNYSNLYEWDAKEACEVQYFAAIGQMKEFVRDGPDKSGIRPEYIWTTLRPVIEENLRYAYPRVWRPSAAKAKKWLGDFVVEVQQETTIYPARLSEEDLKRLTGWKNYLNPPHHGEGEQPKPVPKDAELRKVTGDILKFLHAD